MRVFTVLSCNVVYITVFVYFGAFDAGSEQALFPQGVVVDAQPTTGVSRWPDAGRPPGGQAARRPSGQAAKRPGCRAAGRPGRRAAKRPRGQATRWLTRSRETWSFSIC